MKCLTGIRRFSLPVAAAVVLLAAPACGNGKGDNRPDDVLVAFGDTLLTTSQVVAAIPVGLEPQDSAQLFQAIVDAWIEDVVLARLAEERLPSVHDIDRRVSEYRNRLIVSEYLEKMRQGRETQVHPDSVRKFYDFHRAEMISEVPLVKGIYVCVDDGAPVDDIRRCVFDGSEAAVDELENKWIGAPQQYDYFVDEWVDWNVLADKIPYRFYDADAFLSQNRNFETEANGSVHLLHIADWLPSGSEIPYAFAAPRISAMLEQAQLARYEKDLVRSLTAKAVDDGLLTPGNYDPVKRKFKTLQPRD